MPKVSSRFRNRKINFKSAVPIYVGSLDLPFEDDVDAGTGTPSGSGQASSAGQGTPAPSNHHNIVPPPGFSINEQGETVRVETGVDKEEEHEHHLQAVISASAAALSRSARGAPGGNAGGSSAKPLIAHIPTPDATGMVANYAQFYTHNAYSDPHSYIRSSETVEETMGIAYTMDEDDEDFLQAYNSETKENRKPSTVANGKDRASRSPSPAENGNGNSTPPSPAPADGSLIARNGHYPPLNPISSLKRAQPRIDKNKDVTPGPPSLITEDDFEVVMDLFERITDRKCPTLHLDVSRIPQLEDLEPSFATYLPHSVLKSARNIAKIVYPHWKERRLLAGGKNIVPQLNFDITSETAYVCFRRREVKQARKTRRTDTQTLERLVRLKSDLSSAYELLIKVLDRERCKRETISNEISIFDSRTLLRETKRKLGENDGDETLLIARRKEKKRRRDEYGLQQAGSNKIVIPSRAGLMPVTPGLLQEALPPYKDRTVNANQRIEKDMQRKKEQETGWEDYTDSLFSPLPLNHSSRCWRSTEDIHLPASDTRPALSYTAFENQVPSVVQQIGQRYRKRSGRGGRILLDRLVRCSMTPFFSREPGLDAESVKRREERWRYDSDAASELPQTRPPCIVDDYETRYSAARIALMSGPDLETLYPNTAHLEESFRWQMREPDRLPPVQVTGKLPGHRIAPQSVQQATNGQMNGSIPQIGPTPQMNGQVPAHLASQMMQAAQRMSAAGLPNGAGHQQQLQQQQSQQQQQQQGPVGSAVQSVRRSGSAGSIGAPLPNGTGGHAVQAPQIRRLMWENGGGG